MANFCSNCGAPLQEGQTCGCMETASATENTNQAPNMPVQGNINQQPAPVHNQQPSKFSLYFKGIFEFLKIFVKSPVTAVKEFTEKEDWKSGLFFLGVNILMIAILATTTVAILLSWTNNIPNLGGLPLEDLLRLGFSPLARAGIILKAFFGSVFGFAVLYAILGGLVWLAAKLILKKDCSILKMVAAVTVSTIPLTVALLASLIFVWATTVGNAFMYAGIVGFALLFFFGAGQALDTDNDKNLYIIIGSFAVTFIFCNILSGLIL